MPLILCWLGYFLLKENPQWFNGTETVATIFLIFAIIGTVWTMGWILLFILAFFSD